MTFPRAALASILIAWLTATAGARADDWHPPERLHAGEAVDPRGFAVSVKLPEGMSNGRSDANRTSGANGAAGDGVVITEPVRSLKDLTRVIERDMPELGALMKEASFNFVVNDEMVLAGSDGVELANGDRVELMMALSGG